MEVKNDEVKTKAVSSSKRRGCLQIVDVQFTPMPDAARRLSRVYDLLLPPDDGGSKDERNEDSEG